MPRPRLVFSKPFKPTTTRSAPTSPASRPGARWRRNPCLSIGDEANLHLADARLRAAAEGPVDSVTIETRKPPIGLAGAPYLEKNRIDVLSMAEPTLVFQGNAFDAAAGFPANVNVAAAGQNFGPGLGGIHRDSLQGMRVKPATEPSDS